MSCCGGGGSNIIMADKKRKARRNDDDEEEKPTKEEYAVAKYLRFNCATREGKLHGMEVTCFMGNAAVDKLMESKWSSSKNQKNPLFTNRSMCVSYMVRLMEKGLFHRAERDRKKKDKDKDKLKKKRDKEGANSDQENKEKKKKDKKSQKEESPKSKKVDEKSEKDDKKDEKKDEKKEEKKKKILKLLMPEKQFFEDGNEVFVWIYDPVSAKTFLVGVVIVLGAISLCMFPLWPDDVRVGVYYISLCAAGFVGFILSLVVIRFILFCCIWLLTMGKHHFWMLPNLTEDVGFFESFVPLYIHDVVKPGEPKEDKKKKKKKKEVDEEEEEEKQEDDVKSEDTTKKGEDDSDDFEVIKEEDVKDSEMECEDDDNEDADAQEEENSEDDQEDKKTK